MVRIDRLEIETFKTPEGQDYRKAEMVEKSEVENYFSRKGYKVLEIQQLWRHIHGKLEKDSKIYFFKMASTPGIGERTRNEVSWNRQVGEEMKESDVDCFEVPEIYETGEYKGRFYYLSDYHEGQLLASVDPLKTEGLDEWLDKIVKTNLFFLSLKDINLYRDKGLNAKVEDWDDFQAVNTWYENVKDKGLEEVFKEVKNLENTYEPGVNHGDFVPWHMIQKGEKFVLIDAEHASGLTPRYYDIVYLYHRLATSANNPELAKTYLAKIRHNLPESERDKFDKSIRPILAMRIIGGFLDAKSYDLTDLTYHHKLKENFLKNDLY